MKALLLVHAPGLSPEQATRGDLAANLSDLIADGSFARLSSAPDLLALRSTLAGHPVTFLDLPCADISTFDFALGEVRARAAADGASIAVLSETLLVTQRYFPDIRPGAELNADEAAGFLVAMAK